MTNTARSPCNCAASVRPSRTWPEAGLPLACAMLSSCCCTVQLLLNALNMGCAGFAVLEPWTPLFHCATLASLLHLLLRRGLTTRTLAWALLTGLLATSQHTLALHNQGKLLPELRRAAATLRIYCLPPWGMGQSTHAGQGAGACLIPGLSAGSSSIRTESSIVSDHCHGSSRSSSRPEQLHAAGHVQNVALSVTGVKCEGCARSLRQALLRTEGVLQCEVDFKAKQVRVAFNASATNITLLVAAVVEVDASYEVTPLDTPTSQVEGGCMGRA
ncbi:hypothetical protein V8C86DRAFT_2452048 [Haematococcus lacustris]